MFESMFDPLDSLCHSMNAIENMHEVRFPNIYILSNIIYYILPLTVIIAMAIKSVGFSKVRQTLSNMLHCKKKRSFPLRIYSVNVTKSAENCGFGHIYRRNP